MQQRGLLFIICYIVSTMMGPVTPTTSTNNDFVGLFHFTKVYSDHQDIPIGEDTICTLRIQPSSQQLIQSDGTEVTKTTTAFSQSNNNQYDIFMKIGNNMGGTAIIIPSVSDTSISDDHSNETAKRSTVLAEGAITISGLRSTMMMPPPELYAVERAISNVLPAATNIRIAVMTLIPGHNESNNNSEVVELRIEGSKGYIQAKRIE